MTNALTATILERSDRDEPVKMIAAAERVSLGYVYGVLRAHRPDRERKPRERTGKKRKAILELIAAGRRVGEIVRGAGCSRAYVHRLLDETPAIPPPPY